MLRTCRKADIMADAAHIILTRNAKQCTGNFFIDDEVLESEGYVWRRQRETFAARCLSR